MEVLAFFWCGFELVIASHLPASKHSHSPLILFLFFFYTSCIKMKTLFCSSRHPFSSSYLRSGGGGSRDIRSPQQCFTPPPGQMRHIIPPANSGSNPGSPPRWTWLEDLQAEFTRKHLNQMPQPPEPPLSPSGSVPVWTWRSREMPEIMQQYTTTHFVTSNQRTYCNRSHPCVFIFVLWI